MCRLLAPVVFLLLPAAGRAEVPIPAACRIPNQPPGRCGWCALETLGRHLKIAALYGLAESYASRCSPEDLLGVLRSKGVRYRVQPPGARDTSILRKAVREGLGAAVGFRELHPGKGGHIVTLIDFTDSEVKVIDPNDQDRRTRTMKLEKFLHWWDGFALVVEARDTRAARR